MPRLVLGLTFVLFTLLLSAGRPAHAQGPIVVPRFEAESRAPKAVLVRAQVTAAATITEVALHVRMGSGDGAVLVRPDFTPATDVTIEHEIATSGTRYVPPGSEFVITLEARDADGNRITTPPVTLTYLDTRLGWQTVTARDGLITAYYYGDGLERARRALHGAEAALDKMQARAGVTVDRPFKLMVFTSAEGWRAAAPPPRSRTFEEQVGIAGLAFGEHDLVLLRAVSSGSLNFVQSTAAHEVTHLIVHRAGGSNVAAWLNEGLAVYGQPQPDRYLTEALRRGVAANRLLLVRGIQSLPSQPDLVGLFYAQSYSLVTFLLEQHPPEQMRALLAALRNHASLDEALRRSYGFDQDGLDAAWRRYIGAPPREYASEVPTPIAPRVELATLDDARAGGAAQPTAHTPSGPASHQLAQVGLALIAGGTAAAGGLIARRLLRV